MCDLDLPTILILYICSALSRNLRNPRIAQRKPGIPGLPGKPGIARSDSRNAHSDLCSNQERSWGDQRARDSLKIFTSVAIKGAWSTQ